MLLRPSTERMVADSSRSVNVCRAWDTHSQPARIPSAYWNGVVAVLAFLPNCWANVRATNRRKTLLTMMPLTPPDGFRNAERIDSGTSAWRGILQLGTLKPTSCLIPIWETKSTHRVGQLYQRAWGKHGPFKGAPCNRQLTE